MNDKPQIKLSETVVLIDAAFLNFVITDMKGYFEKTLQRSLQEIDLSVLTTYLTLDAGIKEGKNEVQFLFVYDKESARLVHCRPLRFGEGTERGCFSKSLWRILICKRPFGGDGDKGRLVLGFAVHRCRFGRCEKNGCDFFQ